MTELNINLREAVALAEGLVRHALDHDHARGCDGRHYECTCGYDERLFIFARKLREALPALSVPEGWVAVPRERAEAEIVRVLDLWHDGSRERKARDIVQALAALSAIPSPGGEG